MRQPRNQPAAASEFDSPLFPFPPLEAKRRHTATRSRFGW
jgi:hypothetical protein